MKEYGVPGVALGIVADGGTTIRGLGVTNVEDPLPVTGHTVFPIASISKTFAATAMMRLVEQGKVDLKAPVRTYLPDFRVRDEAASRDVTVWHLLTHLGGWEGQVSGPDRGSDTLKNFLTTITDLMQVAPPGKAWSYNNAGFSIAGRVIEVGDRHVDQPGDARSRVPAARARARRDDAPATSSSSGSPPAIRRATARRRCSGRSRHRRA